MGVAFVLYPPTTVTGDAVADNAGTIKKMTVMTTHLIVANIIILPLECQFFEKVNIPLRIIKLIQIVIRFDIK